MARRSLARPCRLLQIRTGARRAANDLGADVVPDEVKEDRWHRFMQAQQKISARRLKRKVGSRQQVIIDETGPTVSKGARWPMHRIDGAVMWRAAGHAYR